MSDRPEQLREVIAAIDAAGGRFLGIGPLHLRPGVREHFLDWLARTDPDLHADYLRRYATSDYAPKRYLDELLPPRRTPAALLTPLPTRSGRDRVRNRSHCGWEADDGGYEQVRRGPAQSPWS